MTGNGVGPELSGWQSEGETKTQGHFFYAVDISSFVDIDDFIDRTEWYIREIKNSRKADGVNEIRISGERAAESRRRQRECGVELLEATWKIISKLYLTSELNRSGDDALQPYQSGFIVLL